jgi:hypothetical protein
MIDFWARILNPKAKMIDFWARILNPKAIY